MEQQQQHNVGTHTELSRDLGLTTALAIGIGTMIAAGIFTLSGLAIRNVGSAAIVSFLLAAIVATFTALTYCEFVSIYPRSGEGYLYARKTYPAPLAYFVGWALFLGYTSSCAFYIASLSSYFNEFIWHSPIEALSGIVILGLLTLLNIKGTEESGKFQIVVTAAKVALLIWFIAGGLSHVDPVEVMNKFSTDVVAIGGTAAMVFITFFGFSAIAASAGEVKDPVKNIPLAIFISMGLVTVLYTFVVLVVLFANITEYTEASMGEAAKQFLGWVGGYVIIAGAIFSMVSASNASIMAGSRVALAMSQLGHLPKKIGSVNPKTRTPMVSVIVVGVAILIFSVILPLEDLSYFANTVLLLVLILVNAALIIHRKKFPDIERPFKVPLVPLLPIIGILANLYLVAQIFQHPKPLLMALGALAAGMVGFFAWKGTQSESEALPGTSSKIAAGRYAVKENEKPFKILVPISNPATVDQLIKLAAAVAKERDGEIFAIRVAVVPEQMPLSYAANDLEDEHKTLELAHQAAEKYGVPLSSVIRVGHHAAKAILEAARERNCDLILLGWKGYTSTREKIFGEIADAVVTHARSDVMLVKFVGDAPIQKLLLPTAGGVHAKAAEQYGADIMGGLAGSLTLCSVALPNASVSGKKDVENRLQKAVERVSKNEALKVQSKLILSDSIADGIIKEGEQYDAIMVGATRESAYQQILFGSIPEDIATKAGKTVIVLKHHDPVQALVGRVMGE